MLSPFHDVWFYLWLVMFALFVLVVATDYNGRRKLSRAFHALLNENRILSDRLRYGDGGVSSRPLILYHPKPSHWPYYSPPPPSSVNHTTPLGWIPYEPE